MKGKERKTQMTNLVLYRLTKIVSVPLYDSSGFVPILDSQGKELCILCLCMGVPMCVIFGTPFS